MSVGSTRTPTGIIRGRTVPPSAGQMISPIGLTQPVLAQALAAVRTIANDVGLLLAGMYGGRTPLPAVESEDAA